MPSSLRSIVSIVFAGCIAVPLAAHDPFPTRVTWSRDISRIFQARCVGCHVAGGRSPMALTTYEQARPWASAIRAQVLTRRMPIWRAARGYGDFANDPSLSAFDIALVTAWVDGGTPRGEDAPRLQGEGATPGAVARAPRPPASREITVTCGDAPLSGRLLAVSPRLAKGGSAGITAVLADGRREVVAWIRDYDPVDPATYWLRRPIDLARGSRLSVEVSGECKLTATLAR